MQKGKIVLANYDARILKIEIKPKNKYTKVIISSKMYNEQTDKKETSKIIFSDVAAIDFQINYFDNMRGTEGMGLYEITDRKFVEKLVKDVFKRRKEIYILEGDWDYDENDECDMLNTFDVFDVFSEGKDSYHAYVQNVDAGVYIIVAKDIQII